MPLTAAAANPPTTPKRPPFSAYMNLSKGRAGLIAGARLTAAGVLTEVEVALVQPEVRLKSPGRRLATRPCLVARVLDWVNEGMGTPTRTKPA